MRETADMSAQAPEPEDLRTAPAQDDDRVCWVCGALVLDRHCKIVCPRCGFTRDCSDP